MNSLFIFRLFFPFCLLFLYFFFSLDWLHSSFIFNFFNFVYYLFSLFGWALKKLIVCRKNLFSSVIASYFISSKFVFLYLKRITVQVENVRVRGNFVLNLCFTDKLKKFSIYVFNISKNSTHTYRKFIPCKFNHIHVYSIKLCKDIRMIS